MKQNPLESLIEHLKQAKAELVIAREASTKAQAAVGTAMSTVVHVETTLAAMLADPKVNILK